jgi:hypothetical protein
VRFILYQYLFTISLLLQTTMQAMAKHVDIDWYNWSIPLKDARAEAAEEGGGRAQRAAKRHERMFV